MRLLRLDLHAFGAFEDVSLALGRSDGSEPGLTIVYGPNEAGKSTALRAVRQLFFGIEDDRDAFRVTKPKLRIGGLLRDDDGAECGGVRRGSRTDWIYDVDDKKRLAEDSPFAMLLARLDADSYQTAYGLDHDALKSGAEAIALSDGNLDAALYAATARVKDLQGVHRDLIDRSESLFTPQARTGKTINKLLGELSKLNDEAAKAKQPIEDFRRLRTDMERIRAEVETLERERSDLDARLALYRRYADLFGDYVARKEIARELDTLADVPLVEGDLEDRWQALKTASLEATARAEGVESALESARKELAALGEASPLSPQADRIDGLAERALLLENERRDVEEAERGRAPLKRSAEEALTSIGALVSQADLEGLTLPKNFAESLRSLVEERVKLDQVDAQDQVRLSQMQKRLAELQATPGDAALDARFERLDARLRAATEAAETLTLQRDRAAANVQAMERTLNEWIAQRFDVPIEWRRLAALPAPSSESVDDEIERRKKFDERSDSLAARRREVETRLIELHGRLDAAAAENLPSPEDLIAARSRRDETLRRLRERFADASSNPSSSELGEAVDDLAAALAQTIGEADRIADFLAREADRCAKLKQDRSEATVLRQTGVLLESERREFESELRQADDRWAALWTSIGARPSSPKEMRVWRREWEARVREVAEAIDLERERQSLDARIRTAFDELRAELSGDREQPISEQDPAGALALARQTRRVLEAEREKANKDRTEREFLGRDIRARVDDMQANAQRRADWDERWERTTRKLPPSSRSVPGETLAFLDQFAEWRRLREKERDLDDRIAAFATKLERFGTEVDSLAADLADPSPADRFAQVRRWHTALAAARQRDKDVAKLRERLDKLREEGSAAEERLAIAERRLKAFSGELGVADPRELARRLQSIRQKQAATDRARELDARLHRLLPQRTWNDLGRELANWSPETLDAEMESLRTQIERTSGEAKSRYVRLGELQDERKKWDGKSRAAEIEQSKQRLLAEISEAAELYAIYRIAASALEISIERYREKNKSPILERAGKYFSRLTLGRFSGLEPHDAPEGGIAVLGIRGGEGEDPHEVPVSGMSRGTCDQLYLAFRMALWEERLEKGSPLPIVLDDVLVHFDDERAAATLLAFDELAKRTQIVYFTHHRHLVDLARKTLPADRLLVRELQPPGNRS